MKEPEKLAAIVRKLVKNLSVPVTVKIRSGWDEETRNYLEVARIAVSEGARAVCIHPRTRQQMYKGKPDRDAIKHLKESLKVPVFASGGIFKAQDAQDVVNHTGCDVVFVARGALGRPWIFREIKEIFDGRTLTPEPDLTELKEIIKEHFALSMRFYNDFRTLKRMYKYISWYLMRYKNIDEIMKKYAKIKDVKDLDGFLAKIEVDERRHLYFA